MSSARYKCDIPTLVPTCLLTRGGLTAAILSSEATTVSRPGPAVDPRSSHITTLTARATELLRSGCRRRGINATFRRSFRCADPRRPSRLPFFQVKLQLQRHLSTSRARARRLIAKVTELQVAVGMSPARYKCDIPTFVPTCTPAAAFTDDILSSETATVSRPAGLGVGPAVDPGAVTSPPSRPEPRSCCTGPLDKKTAEHAASVLESCIIGRMPARTWEMGRRPASREMAIDRLRRRYEVI